MLVTFFCPLPPLSHGVQNVVESKKHPGRIFKSFGVHQEHLQEIREDQHLLEEDFQRLCSVTNQVEKLVLSAQRRIVEDDEHKKVKPFCSFSRGNEQVFFFIGVTAAC